MTHTLTKSTVELYKIRFEKNEYWADISLDCGEVSGRISIASDFGNWSNWWGACGTSFKEFLISLDIQYTARKFGADGYFNSEQTIAHFRHIISESLLPKEDKHILYAEVESLCQFDTKDGFCGQLWHQKNVLEFFDHTPPLCTDIHPLFVRFWDMIWGAIFIEQLKKEIAEGKITQ